MKTKLEFLGKQHVWLHSHVSDLCAVTLSDSSTGIGKPWWLWLFLPTAQYNGAAEWKRGCEDPQRKPPERAGPSNSEEFLKDVVMTWRILAMLWRLWGLKERLWLKMVLGKKTWRVWIPGQVTSNATHPSIQARYSTLFKTPYQLCITFFLRFHCQLSIAFLCINSTIFFVLHRPINYFW